MVYVRHFAPPLSPSNRPSLVEAIFSSNTFEYGVMLVVPGVVADTALEELVGIAPDVARILEASSLDMPFLRGGRVPIVQAVISTLLI